VLRKKSHKKLQNDIVIIGYFHEQSTTKNKVFRKLFVLSDFAELFSLIILVKKTFWISLRNDGVIVKILNTEIPGVPKCLQHSLFCEYLCTDK
jgi:hypothetical protein